MKICFLLFRTLGSFQPTTALILPPGIPVLCHLQSCSHTPGFSYTQMKFLFRVAIIHAKRERTGSSLLSSLVLSLHTSTEDLCSKFVPCKSSSIKLSTCKSTFACAITSVSSQIWHTPLWAHPRQVGVHLCTLLYRTVWSTIVHDFYFKPMLSARKHKCSNNIDGTNILFLKEWWVAQLCLNFQHMDCSLPGSSCRGDSPDKNTGVGCHAVSKYCKIKSVSFIVFVFYMLFVWKIS